MLLDFHPAAFRAEASGLISGQMASDIQNGWFSIVMLDFQGKNYVRILLIFFNIY